MAPRSLERRDDDFSETYWLFIDKKPPSYGGGGPCGAQIFKTSPERKGSGRCTGCFEMRPRHEKSKKVNGKNYP